MPSTVSSILDSTFHPRQRAGAVTPAVRFGLWTRLKHQLPYRLRPLCTRVEHYLFDRQGLPVWVDDTAIRVSVDAAPVPSDSPDHREEHELMKCVLGALKADDLFLDVGSHVGIYALVAAVRVGSGGRVIAFEPSPMTADKLARNIHLNGAGRSIRVERIALSDAGGSVVMVTNGSSAMNSIFTGVPPGHRRHSYPERRVTVRSERLDTFFDATRRTVAKIDTEGHEIAVLRGAPRLLKSPHARIFVELHPWAWGDEAAGWAELQSLCAQSGRSIRLLDGSTLDAPAHRRVELVRA
jgi:FkbM family methyltransferase